MTPVDPSGHYGTADPDPRHDFTYFYNTTSKRTFGTAYRAAGGNEDVARDATQEAYLVMLKRWLDGKKPEGDVHRYIVGIAVRKVADHYRSSNRLIALKEEHDCGGEETGYVEVLDTMTVLQAVRDFLDRQPSQRRAVGVLYFLEEFDYPEIAAVLGMSRSTARTHVQRLREVLQPLIDDQGGEQS